MNNMINDFKLLIHESNPIEGEIINLKQLIYTQVRNITPLLLNIDTGLVDNSITNNLITNASQAHSYGSVSITALFNIENDLDSKIPQLRA